MTRSTSVIPPARPESSRAESKTRSIRPRRVPSRSRTRSSASRPLPADRAISPEARLRSSAIRARVWVVEESSSVAALCSSVAPVISWTASSPEAIRSPMAAKRSEKVRSLRSTPAERRATSRNPSEVPWKERLRLSRKALKAAPRRPISSPSEAGTLAVRSPPPLARSSALSRSRSTGRIRTRRQ